jgi:hypothetical protein
LAGKLAENVPSPAMGAEPNATEALARLANTATLPVGIRSTPFTVVLMLPLTAMAWL